MALFSNTLVQVRHYLSNAVGDLIYGRCGENGEDTANIYAPFLWQPDNYYSDHKYEVYVYKGKNKGETRRVASWDLSEYLLEVHAAYGEACDDDSYIELHHIFSEDDYRKAINLAIEALAGKYLVDIIDDTTITLVADTYEYALPLSMLYLYRVTTEDEVDGDKFFETGIIDPRNYDIIKAYPPYLKLNKSYYSITAGKDLRLEGQGAQGIIDDDSGIINLPPDWLIQKAITFLPQNKIQSNNLENTYRQALILSAREPRNWPDPRAQRIVE